MSHSWHFVSWLSKSKYTVLLLMQQDDISTQWHSKAKTVLETCNADESWYLAFVDCLWKDDRNGSHETTGAL